MLKLSPFSPFIPFDESDKQPSEIDSLGQKPRCCGLFSKTYLVYNEKEKKWGVEQLGLIKRIIRFVTAPFGQWACYRETHKKVVNQQINDNPDLIQIPRSIQAIIKLIFNISDPSLPTNPSDETIPYNEGDKSSDSSSSPDSHINDDEKEEDATPPPSTVGSPADGYQKRN